MDFRLKFHNFRLMAVAFGLSLMVAYSLGIFFFDRHLIVFKKILPNKTTIFTNVSSLGLCWRYSLLFFGGSAVLVLFLGIFWTRKKGRPLAEGLARQAWTFAPLLLLAFGRFLEGKYLKVVVDIPLYPLLAAVALAAVLSLNAALHFDFSLIRFIRKRLFPPGRALGEKPKIVILVAVLAGLWVHLLTLSVFYKRYSSLMVFLGDEPKYLRMTYSLASDGDLDLTDDFVGDDVEVQWLLEKAKASGEKAIGHFSVVGREGGIYHIHMPGLSFLLLPSFLLDLKVFQRDIPNTQALMFLPAKMIFTRAWMLLIALGFFLLMARFVYRLFRSPLILAVLLLALMFLTQVPEFALQVYPELAAALFLLIGLNALFFPFRRKGLNGLALVAGIGFLPWLHQRFIPLSVSLFALFLFQELFPARKWKKIMGVSLGLAAVGFGYAAFFYAITGSPLPWSLYSQWGTSYTRAAIFPSGFFGYIFDTGTGLLALYPVFLFALTGMYWGIGRDRRRAWMLLAVVLPYFCLISITPWHGIAWETMRMSLILFPLFLLFVGYTLQAFLSRISWPQIVFCAAGLVFLLLNNAFHFWTISLGNVLILPHQVGYIIQCAVVLVLFYLALWGLDAWTKNRQKSFSALRLGRFLREISLRPRRFLLQPILRKAVIGLALSVQAVYVLAYLNNWQDKALSQSYFAAVSKVERLRPALLHPQGQPSSARAWTDAKFIEIFEWNVPFQLLPGKRRQAIRFGPGFLLDSCPPGCYKVDVEFIDPPPRFSLLSLDFMGETREMKVIPLPGKGIVSTIYLAFDDARISPEFILRYEDVLTRPVKGRLRFFPIPSLVFDKSLMVRLSEGLYPNCIRPSGSHTYLGFIANARKDNSSFRFSLSILENPAGLGAPTEIALGPYSLKFRHRGRHKIDIRLDRPGWAWPEKGTLAISVRDGHGRPLDCRSVWLPCRPRAWLIPWTKPDASGLF